MMCDGTLSPCGRGWRASLRAPGEGFVIIGARFAWTPHPASLRSATFSRKGRRDAVALPLPLLRSHDQARRQVLERRGAALLHGDARFVAQKFQHALDALLTERAKPP